MKTQNWYNTKPAMVFFHATSWLFTLFLPLLLRHFSDDGKRMMMERNRMGRIPPRREHPFHFAAFEVCITLLWILLFYFNVYFLIPRLFREKKYVRYALIQVFLFIAVLITLSFFFQGPPGIHRSLIPIPAFNLTLFPFLFVQAASITYTTIAEKLRNDRLKKEQENEHLKSELSFLRSQISPHFIFNVLNNMVSLARKKSDRLEPALIELSGLMRYMLYEADESKVPLEKELGYLKNYIELQQMRFGREVEIITTFPECPTGVSIEPMMLIPFVENAFKHVHIHPTNRSFIELNIQFAEGSLYMTVRNSYEPGGSGIKDKHSGIGLQNVRRRLNLLYQQEHALTISEQDQQFNIQLQINLS